MARTDTLDALELVLEQRKGASADSSYVASLYHKGLNKILEKVGEEATETILAAKDGDKDALVAEVSDLWFHTMVMLCYEGLSVEHIMTELDRRFGLSGLDEKASRTKR